VLKFADDTKLFDKVTTAAQCKIIQDDLARLEQWSRDWQMPFNTEVMHLGRNNQHYLYYLANQPLGEVEEEIDLGMYITSDLKSSKQCQIAYNKAIKILAVINRTVTYKNRSVLLSLYKSLVRPLLEYATPAWSPHYTKDKLLLERAQHRFTRMVTGLKQLEYAERLRALDIWSLEERRNRADLIEVFRIIKGFSTVSCENLFDIISDTRTRGHSLKLKKRSCKTDLRKFFFSERVVSRWNRRDQQCVDAQSIIGLKAQLSRCVATDSATLTTTAVVIERIIYMPVMFKN
jgi:hypothetical protein